MECVAKELNHQIYENYLIWLRENGCVFPKVEYPAVFEHGLIGGRALEDIGPNKAYVFIPFSVCITLQKAKNSEISHVLNDPIFVKYSKSHGLCLSAFVLFEKLKGKSSFWYHYFEAVPKTTCIFDWPDSELAELQDNILISSIKSSKKRLFSTLRKVSEVLERFSDLFPSQNLIDDLYWAWRFCNTRQFALKESMIIPLADNLNHGEAYINYESKSRSFLLSPEELGKVNYSDFCSPESGEISIEARNNTNRLEKYLEKNALPEINTVWDLDQLLCDYRSSSEEDDERYIIEFSDDDWQEADLTEPQAEENEEDRYFVISTGTRTRFLKGEQVFNAYGRLSNRNLLMDYGFTLLDNRYDTVYFFMWTDGREGRVEPHEMSERDQENSELYGIKMNMVNFDVLVYFREKMFMSVTSFPTVLRVELSIIDKFLMICIDILEELEEFEGTGTTFKKDQKLASKEIGGHLRAALYYRMGQKRILLNQIKMVEDLKEELRKIERGLDISTHALGRDIEEVKGLYYSRLYLKCLHAFMTKGKES